MTEDRRASEQIRRICEMEEILDRAGGAVAALSDALDGFAEILPELDRLTEYYGSEQWRSDYDDDAAGRLPSELKRGVLSEDSVYDLLTDYVRVLEEMRRIAEARAMPAEDAPPCCCES